MKKAPPIDGRFVSLGEYRFEKNGQGFVIVSNEGTKGHVTADAVVFLPVDRRAGRRGRSRPPKPATDDACKALEAELKKLQADRPEAATMAMSVVEEKRRSRTRRSTSAAASTTSASRPRAASCRWRRTAGRRRFPTDQSGRQGAGRLARVAGQPADGPRDRQPRLALAVRRRASSAPSDNFGTTGETPSHPELLDHLAVRFVADGWSVKKLVRRIVLAATYRQSSADDREATARRPGEPAVRPREPPPARRRVHPRHDAGGQRQARPDRGGPTFPATLAADYGYKATRHPPQRLPAGVPQRAAGAVRGVRLRRPEHGRPAGANVEHGRPAGAVPDEPPVRRSSRRGTPPTRLLAEKPAGRRGAGRRGPTGWRWAARRPPASGGWRRSSWRRPATRRRRGRRCSRRCSRRPTSGT